MTTPRFRRKANLVLEGNRFVRALRRRTQSVQGKIVGTGGEVTELDQETLLAPLEGALQLIAGGLVCLAVALVLSR